MNILDIAIIIFIILESLNVIILYKKPTSKKGNGVAVFNNYKEIQNTNNNKLFVKYLINWVAGTKLIFIMLLLVILLTTSVNTKIFSLIVLIISITTYYFKLHPIIKELDTNNQITPKGYSKTLFTMITSFIILFIIAILIYILFH